MSCCFDMSLSNIPLVSGTIGSSSRRGNVLGGVVVAAVLLSPFSTLSRSVSCLEMGS